MLVGFFNPSHDEAQATMSGRYPDWLTVDDTLGLALTKGPKWSPWSFELIQAVVNEQQERDYISTTALLGCARGTVLERREKYVESLDRFYASLRGTMVHRALESAARPGSLAEWRFYAEVDGQAISCSPDLITPDDGTLWDYKVTENPPSFGYMWKSHKLQLQFNRFIVNNATSWTNPEGEPADVPVNPRSLRFRNLAIVYLGPKAPKVIVAEKKVEVTSPNGRKVKKPVGDVWSDETVLAELRPRMHAMVEALESYPVWPTGLEEKAGFEGPADWRCPGSPLCNLPNCLAKRYPDGLIW